MLSFHRKNIDLDEFVSGSIRNGTLTNYVKNIPVSIRNDLIQMLNVNNKFGIDKNKIDYVLALENSWSAKCIPGYGLGGIADNLSRYFIETALKQNTELFYTKRRDIKAQCWSMIMAGVRSRQTKDKPNLAYVSLNVDSYPEIQPVYVDPIAAKTSIENIVSLSKEVNSLYDRFGGTMMVYEDTIDRGDFSLCGISNNSVESYKKLKIRLKRPEPRYPEQHAINWKEIDKLIENNIQV